MQRAMKRKGRKRTLLRLVRRRVYSSSTSCSRGVRESWVVCVDEEGVNSGAVVEGVDAIVALIGGS
jgi:hypothetical protein